jgi:glutamate-1-semialdehyde aminotransferase
MAARLKTGLNDVLARTEVPGHAHGMASLVHLTMRDCDCDREMCTMPYEEIGRASDPAVTVPLRRAMINAGVDVMGRGAFIVSATHREQDVDRTLEAFEEALGAMRAEGVV